MIFQNYFCFWNLACHVTLHSCIIIPSLSRWLSLALSTNYCIIKAAGLWEPSCICSKMAPSNNCKIHISIRHIYGAFCEEFK